MQYVKVTFSITSQDLSDMLVAELSDIGYNGFEEHDNKLLAYIEEAEFREDELREIISIHGASYDTEIVPQQNWNALWESNFEPVVVADFCTIRAHFHEMQVATPYDIVITPKMSFGTGHHATTQLMIRMMIELDFKGKSVFDFGTGTGVLAILAEMLAATDIIAIDNDEWSVENARENIEHNQCKKIIVQLGSLEDLPSLKTDIVLANINRHILLNYMEPLYKILDNKGLILMSGLLAEDQEIIVKTAEDAGFHFVKMNEQTNWIALLFHKI